VSRGTCSELDVNHALASNAQSEGSMPARAKAKAKRKCRVRSMTVDFRATYRHGENRRYEKGSGPIRFTRPSY
jgi:hypothetical protein